MNTQQTEIHHRFRLDNRRDSSVSKSSASHAGDPDLGGLTWVTECINESRRDYQL